MTFLSRFFALFDDFCSFFWVFFEQKQPFFAPFCAKNSLFFEHILSEKSAAGVEIRGQRQKNGIGTTFGVLGLLRYNLLYIILLQYIFLI